MTALTNQLGEMTGNIEKFSLSATNINMVPMIWVEFSGDGFSTKLILDKADYQQFAQQLINAGNAMFPPDPPPAEETEESLTFPLKTQKAEEAKAEIEAENEVNMEKARQFIEDEKNKGKSLEEIAGMVDMVVKVECEECTVEPFKLEDGIQYDNKVFCQETCKDRYIRMRDKIAQGLKENLHKQPA